MWAWLTLGKRPGWSSRRFPKDGSRTTSRSEVNDFTVNDPFGARWGTSHLFFYEAKVRVALLHTWRGQINLTQKQMKRFSRVNMVDVLSEHWKNLI